MNSYCILRNNKEHGPYTLKELASQSLLSTDLIWVEGMSVAWRSPMEIDELKKLVKSPEDRNNLSTAITIKPFTDESTPKQKAFQSQPSIFVRRPVKPAETESHFSIPEEENSATLYAEKKLLKESKKQSLLSYNFLGLGLLLIGAAMGAFVMKQMISSFGNEPAISIAKAKEIESLKGPVSTTTDSAEALFTPVNDETTVSIPVKKDSSEVKVNPVPKAAAAVAVFKAGAYKKAGSESEPEAEAAQSFPPDNSLSDESKVSAENGILAQELKKQPSSKNSVELSANDYKVGLFGGVSGLQILVTNSTSQNLENLLVEVEFLKSNGKVVKTEILSVSNIASGTSKSVAVPSSNRGVKVRYRVVTTNTAKETIATDNM
jgi:hypothetical protein